MFEVWIHGWGRGSVFGPSLYGVVLSWPRGDRVVGPEDVKARIHYNGSTFQAGVSGTTSYEVCGDVTIFGLPLAVDSPVVGVTLNVSTCVDGDPLIAVACCVSPDSRWFVVR
jgi:hypothetical protein